MNPFAFLGFKSSGSSDELPDIFPFPFLQRDFVEIDVVTLYSKILTDVVERTQGIKDEILPSLWDNCLKSENSEGLITMLSKAMADKKDLFLVWDNGLKLLRKADIQEERQIREDYKTKNESATGIYISFTNYKRSDMVKLYSGLEHCTVGSFYKTMNLSKAIQIKIHDMRGSTGLNDRTEFVTQAQSMAKGLGKGQDILTDAKDVIETAKPDISATESAEAFINKKLSKYLGLPASYFTGEQTKGLNANGDADSNAIERGLKGYYYSIIKPVMESLFDIKTKFKTEDFDQIDSALNVLKAFELTSEQYISTENKQLIVNQVFGLPEDEKGEEVKQPETPPAVGKNPPPVKNEIP